LCDKNIYSYLIKIIFETKFNNSVLYIINNTDRDTKARAGEIITSHGNIPTPVFMPVGTAGAVKGVHFRELKDDIKAEIVLCNTYHLYLRPGTGVIEKCGGLHRFCGWDKPILTDSGGYQVYSLSNQRKLKEEGMHFQSHIDGSKHVFTPEGVIDIQRSIGGDIIMAFDECTPFPCDYAYARQSTDLTHRWLQRCMSRFRDTTSLYGYEQFLFPIVQGSVYRDLRIMSAEAIVSHNASGNAIGGLSVGEPVETMYEMVEIVCSILPADKPRYLMGVGTPVNILESIALGIDMFDCVIPTRNGRNGWLFTRDGIINIKNEKWKTDFSPIDVEGDVFVDKEYSKAFLRHLFIAGEMLGPMIATIHNLNFYMWLFKEAREKIINGSFDEWKKKMVNQLQDRL
jgi:queuine tRNA-ribosyltransferase